MSNNETPQFAMGLVESIGYPVLFLATGDAKEGLTAIGAWIGLKTFGSWHAFQKDDDGRRRLYAFLIANAIQVGIGAVVSHVLSRWAVVP